jgi:hypothetical protein
VSERARLPRKQVEFLELKCEVQGVVDARFTAVQPTANPLAHNMLVYRYALPAHDFVRRLRDEEHRHKTNIIRIGDRIGRRASGDGDVSAPPKEQSPMNSQAQVLQIRNAV